MEPQSDVVAPPVQLGALTPMEARLLDMQQESNDKLLLEIREGHGRIVDAINGRSAYQRTLLSEAWSTVKLPLGLVMSAIGGYLVFKISGIPVTPNPVQVYQSNQAPTHDGP